MLNATCPGNFNVHADKGGPIYMNGKEGKLKKFNERSPSPSGLRYRAANRMGMTSDLH